MEQKTRNKLFMIAAGLVRATMADYEDDYPKTMPKSVLKKINALNDKLRDYAYELGQMDKMTKFFNALGIPEPHDLNNPIFRKWWAEHEPVTFSKYLYSVYEREYSAHIFLPYQKILEAQLKLPNLYDYLKRIWQEWGYKGCLYRCDVCGKKDCKYYGVGKVCKYPAVEKMMERSSDIKVIRVRHIVGFNMGTTAYSLMEDLKNVPNKAKLIDYEEGTEVGTGHMTLTFEEETGEKL